MLRCSHLGSNDPSRKPYSANSILRIHSDRYPVLLQRRTLFKPHTSVANSEPRSWSRAAEGRVAQIGDIGTGAAGVCLGSPRRMEDTRNVLRPSTTSRSRAAILQ
jgi:hypothetical protein